MWPGRSSTPSRRRERRWSEGSSVCAMPTSLWLIWTPAGTRLRRVSSSSTVRYINSNLHPHGRYFGSWFVGVIEMNPFLRRIKNMFWARMSKTVSVLIGGRRLSILYPYMYYMSSCRVILCVLASLQRPFPSPLTSPSCKLKTWMRLSSPQWRSRWNMMKLLPYLTLLWMSSLKRLADNLVVRHCL